MRLAAVFPPQVILTALCSQIRWGQSYRCIYCRFFLPDMNLVVENKGFKTMIKAHEPCYQLPASLWRLCRVKKKKVADILLYCLILHINFMIQYWIYTVY